MSVKPVKVIDLFAGPGGLGEGFASCQVNGEQAFKIAISIEKEESAHRTLRLRSFFRQFETDKAPEAYYEFLKGNLGGKPEDELYLLPEFQTELEQASREAQKITLGKDNPKTVYKKIREAIGTEECILIGGPPCQAYSLVGRSRNYGAKDKDYSATEDHRNFLYLEYLKIISKFQPMIFVMENVKGMLSAKIDGELIFDSILRDLHDPHKSTKVSPDTGRKKHKYIIKSFSTTTDNPDLFSEDLRPQNYIIKTEDYGLPQARHRVILLGIREEIAKKLDAIETLEKCKIKPTVKQVISDLPELRSRLSKEQDSYNNWKNTLAKFGNDYLPRLKSDEHVSPELFQILNGYLDQIDDSPDSFGANTGQIKTRRFESALDDDLSDWYSDTRLDNYITNHEARGHIVPDLYRYFYYSTFAKLNGTSPKSNNLPQVLWPKHKNFESGKFSDRFRVQLANSQGTTVTSHISKDGHYFIHYDPLQCRSLTVREAARIQTFPDNYFFVGNRTQQYVQVGNAVPPYLAKKIACVIYKLLIFSST